MTTTTPLLLVKQHLNIDHDADDALLAHYTAAAEAWIASYIGQPFDAGDPRLVQAVLLLAGHSYAVREAATFARPFSTPYGVEDVLSGAKMRITGHQAGGQP